MNTQMPATGFDDARLQHASRLQVLVAQSNATPEDVGPITEAFQRVLDIAAHLPGGQQALIDGLASCKQVNEVLAFCKLFVSVVALDCGAARYPMSEAYIQPAHDTGEAA